MTETPERPEPGAASARPLPSAEPGGAPIRPVPRTPPSRWRRVARAVARLGLALGFVVVVAVGLVLGTQTGLHAALALTQQLAPGLIRVDVAEGRVLGRLHLRGLELQLPSLRVLLGEAVLDWSPWTALTGTLEVRRLEASDVDLTPLPGEKSESSGSLPNLALPIGIRIEDAEVRRLRVLDPGRSTPRFALDRAALKASLEGGELTLGRLELDLPTPRLQARAQGDLGLTGLYPLDLDLSWDLRLEPSAVLHGQGRLSGDLRELVLEHRIQGSVRARLDLRARDLLRGARWDGTVELDGVTLPDFSPGAPETDVKAQLATHGDLDSATLGGNLDARAPGLPDFGRLAAKLDVRWQERVLSIRTLDVTESVSGARLDVLGTLDLTQAPAALDVKGDWERLRWPLSGEILVESPRGRLGVSGAVADYGYSLAGLVQGPGIPVTDIKLVGRGTSRGTAIEELLAKTLDGRIQANGDLAWAPSVAWDLKLRGQDLNPAALAPGLDDRVALAMDSQGSLNDYRYDLSASTTGPGLPPARLTLDGRGDIQGTEILGLRLEALNGRIEGSGRVGWEGALSWDGSIAATGIDPGAYAAQWPGRIDGRIATQGSLQPNGPRVGAVLDGIRGELRGYPIAASGRLLLESGTLRLDGIGLASGPSAFRLDGSWGQTLDLRFDLASPDLASLLPQAKGSIQAKGRVGGNPKAPQVQADLSARDLEVSGQGIASLSGNADVALSPDGPFRLALDGKELALGSVLFDTLTVRGQGSMPSHRLSLTLAGPQLSTRIEASGSLAEDGRYRGSLDRLDLDHDAFGAWRLQKPMPLAVALPKVSAGPLCLRNRKGSGGCVGFDQAAAGQWTAELDLDPLGVELVQGLLPDTVTAEGSARLKGRFQADGSVLTGKAVAEVPQGRLRLNVGGSRGEVLELSGSRITVESDAKALGARLAMAVKGLGEVSGQADLPGWRLARPAAPEQPLRGALRARVANLSRISSLVPDLTGIAGTLDADLSMGGTLAAPDIQGQASAKGLAAEVPLIGLKIADGNLSLIAGKDRLDLQGQAGVGGGRLELSGELRLAPGGATGQTLIAGERLKIADTKEYFVMVSPRIEATLAPDGLRVGGEVLVPEARIRPRSLPAGTVSPSPDVVLADRAGHQAKPLPLDIDLSVKMGDDVTIDAFGVRGRLVGDLRVFQTPGKPMLGDGQLSIVDGLYRMSAGFGLSAEIGAPLTIEQGRLIFAKTPVDNPGLLLQAQREGGDTAAGVRVLGTIREPKLAFFSESNPNMTQADITKYLLTGIPPSRDPGMENRSLSFGTYIAPKLYMEYESAIGDRQDSIKLRYDLTRRIELQTQTGDTPSADILYKLDNDWLSAPQVPDKAGK